MKKLLHERLREFARILDEDGNFTFLELNEAESLAGEIEKYYIPRPRFDDGEPVQFGDYVDGCNGPVDSFLIYEDGSGTVYGEADLPYKVDDGAAAGIDEPHKRPKPKILDADGVEIKVGDVVWHVSEPGEVGEVETLIPASAHVCVLWSTGAELYTPGVDLTHREPDSLEKLRDDMIDLCGTDGEDSSLICDELADCAARLTALIERGV